jgi:hypothetical protein
LLGWRCTGGGTWQGKEGKKSESEEARNIYIYIYIHTWKDGRKEEANGRSKWTVVVVVMMGWWRDGGSGDTSGGDGGGYDW